MCREGEIGADIEGGLNSVEETTVDIIWSFANVDGHMNLRSCMACDRLRCISESNVESRDSRVVYVLKYLVKSIGER